MAHKTLGQSAKGMSYNLHFVRFIAALLVIISHSYALSTGSFDQEWFYVATNGQITMGAFAVGIFFFYSGFLIVRSLEKKPTAVEFIIGRCIRIFPVLIVVIILTIVVLGPIASSYSMSDYFSNKMTYEYLLNCIFILKHTLPGVFENNIYTDTINGALWTLPVEFFCYIFCMVASRLKILTTNKMWMTIPLVGLGSGVVYYFAGRWDVEILVTVWFPIVCFYVGALLCVYKNHVIFDIKILFVCIMFFGLFSAIGLLKVGFVVFFLYILIYFAFGSRNLVGKLYKLGNYSYAMYLCGFPIQQLIVWINGGKMEAGYNIVISIPIILVVSILLYYFVEKKTVDLYKRGKKWKS